MRACVATCVRTGRACVSTPSTTSRDARAWPRAKPTKNTHNTRRVAMAPGIASASGESWGLSFVGLDRYDGFLLRVASPGRHDGRKGASGDGIPKLLATDG